MSGPTLIVFLGGLGGSPVEEIVGTARWAASLDSIEAALASGAFSGAILVTDGQFPSGDVPGVTIDADPAPLHFGRRLAGVLRRHRVEAAVYMGAGSVPLFRSEDFAALAQRVKDGRAVTNNPYSSDLLAFPVPPDGRVLKSLEGCDRDNALARVLAEQAGLVVEALPRTVQTQMDIDGPSDLAVLTLAATGGPRLRAYLDALCWDTTRLQRASALFADPNAQVVVAGRVGSHVWQYLERETACRVRLFSEERGLEAQGRAADASARSLLAYHLQAAGTVRFFQNLAELGDAAFIDTRVLLAHRGVMTSREDRFLSDAGRWPEIRDPFLREFTRAAAEAPLPVILGGHSLVSGGLMLLTEFAWRKKEAGT